MVLYLFPLSFSLSTSFKICRDRRMEREGNNPISLICLYNSPLRSLSYSSLFPFSSLIPVVNLRDRERSRWEPQTKIPDPSISPCHITHSGSSKMERETRQPTDQFSFPFPVSYLLVLSLLFVYFYLVCLFLLYLLLPVAKTSIISILPSGHLLSIGSFSLIYFHSFYTFPLSVFPYHLLG